MTSYLIKKDSNTNEIVYMEYDLEGYKFTPSLRNDAYLQVNHVVVIKPSLIEKVLALKFEKIFKKLAYRVFIFREDEDSDDDANLILGEIVRMQEILLNKYNKFLSKEKEMKYLKKLEYLEKEMKYKKLLLLEMIKNKEEKVARRK